MTTKDYLLDIVTRFRLTLDAHKRQLEGFDQYAIQVEGWLKGELVCLFNSEKVSGRLDDFQVEYPSGSGQEKVDLFLKLHGTPVWIELKHLQIGWAGEQHWGASDYFVKSMSICSDAEKLSKIPVGNKYILILATKNPRCDKPGNWERGLDTFRSNFTTLHINSYLNPSEFPQSYFLGLLELLPSLEAQSINTV